MKAILPYVEKYLGPKAAGVLTAAVTAGGQIETALGVSPIGTGALDIVTDAFQSGNWMAFLPAPIAGLAAMLFRSTNKPVEKPIPDGEKQSRDILDLRGEVEDIHDDIERIRDDIEDLRYPLGAIPVPPVAPPVPVTPDVSQYYGSISVPVSLDMSLPLNLRQNNPGNLEATPAGKNRWNGEVPSLNRYASFSTPAYGVRAMMYLLRKVYYQRYSLNTIEKIIGRWAPIEDPGNSPESFKNYMNSVASDLGIRVNTPLLIGTNDEQLILLVQAMARFEGGRELPYGAPVYNEALELLK